MGALRFSHLLPSFFCFLRRIQISVVVVTPMMMIAAAAHAQLPATADASVTSASPRTNYGTSPVLALASGTTTYIRFSLSSLPPSATVQKATLMLFVDGVSTPGTHQRVRRCLRKLERSRVSPLTISPATAPASSPQAYSSVSTASVNRVCGHRCPPRRCSNGRMAACPTMD